MIEFENPSDILPAITDLTHPISGLIKDLPTIEKVVYSICGYNYLRLVIENSNITEVTEKNNEAILEVYNLSGMIKEEMKIFPPSHIKLQENPTNLYGLVWDQCFENLKSELHGVNKFVNNSKTYNAVWLISNVK